MASRLISRLLPPESGAHSIYETIQQHDEDSGDSEIQDRAALVIDEENLREDFTDLDPQDVHLNTSLVPGEHVEYNDSGSPVRTRKRQAKWSRQPKWYKTGHKLRDVEEADDDVPASLLIEGTEPTSQPTEIDVSSLPPPPSATTDHVSRRQWDQATSPQAAHGGGSRPQSTPVQAVPVLKTMAAFDPKEKAMYRWINVEDLDSFLFEVYNYYENHGYWSTNLQRLYGLLTVAFMVGFFLFLTQCVDYREIKGSTHMSQILVPRCASKMGFFPNAVLWVTTFLWMTKCFHYIVDIGRLNHLHDFYHYLLLVPEQEIQSISWQEVVSRLMALRDANPHVTKDFNPQHRRWLGTQSKQRMDAHDIANRLMRKQNYFIAMINKDILDMTLPIPFLRNRQLYTRTLEWNLDYCIMEYVFNREGQIRQLFLKDTHRRALSEGLKRRFVFAGTTSLIGAPFLIGYHLIRNFFLQFKEYQKNPAQLGSRQYNPLAEWKFREFNELRHLFQRRVNMSHPFAARYVNQFPKDKTIQTARFVTFVSGALVSVLGVATVLDQESFLGFEITPGRTALFYITLFGSVWAVARGMLPEENLVYEPAHSLQQVIQFTHYAPAHWHGRLHTVEVKQEFEQLYQMKIVVLIEEVLSMIFTPFVLWYSLPKCSDRIIDFFREFTVHVDGLGYVCSFAEFKFQMNGNVAPVQAPQPNAAVTAESASALRNGYFASKDQKLEQSYWGFMNDYARNPKTDVRFPYADARLRAEIAPGAGLTSSAQQFGVDGPSAMGDGQDLVVSPHQAAAFGSGTPLQSLLLDPHHQPSAHGYARSPQTLKIRGNAATQARLGSLRHRLELRQASGGVETSLDDVHAKSKPEQSAEELGSWNDDQDEHSESEGEDIDQLTSKGRGVLGLIQQLQKGQGEASRAGTGI